MPETGNTTNFANQINAFSDRLGIECKALHKKIGDLSGLSTTVKTSIVVALNEQVNALETLKDSVNGNTSNIEAAQAEISNLKTAVENTTSLVDSKITEAKQAVKDDLLGGAGAAYDTLKELADLIAGNQDAITALQTIAAGHVKYGAAQELTDEQKAQARENIGAASSADVTALRTKVTANESAIAAKAEQSDLDAVSAKVAANETAVASKASQADLETLKAKIGDTETDFVATFEAALSETPNATEGV